jgi:uncharacterized protein (DUF924 family)/uncharacterized glyoxalase superfamily protein PhnB
MMPMTPDDVLSFWLHEIGPSRWYEQDDALDAEIRERFEPLWRKARANRLGGWADSPRGTLALLILLDQFPRNMFRGEATAFATDKRALNIAKSAVAAGMDREITEPERQFFYLPYMHSEDLTDQHACVALIADRMAEGDNLHHARVHRAVIERFGRFPYRNAALGRESTDAERAYIAAGRYAPESWTAPSGRTPIQVYLVVSGAAAAMDWYTRAFGAEETTRMPAQDGQRLMYGHMTLFGGAIMLSDAFPDMMPGIVAPDVSGSSSITVTVAIDDPAQIDAIMARAAEAGATVTMPAADMFWGGRYGRLIDPFGHHWAFAGPDGATA